MVVSMDLSGYFDDVYYCVQPFYYADHGLGRLFPPDIPVGPHRRQEVQSGRQNFVVEYIVENLAAENPVVVNLSAVNPF